MGKRRSITTFVLAVVFIIGMMPAAVFAADDVHQIVIASDRHNNETAIGEAMAGMPDTAEYVSIIGDLVGGRDDMTPPFDSSTIANEITSVFPALAGPDMAARISILWGSHDKNVNDDAKIVFADKGIGSGLMKTGYNADGTAAYYIYGIAFYDMTDNTEEGGDAAASAAAFKGWIDTVQDTSIPIIVICHVPMHYARKDNPGAVAWSRALNYAAAGTEELQTFQPKRNVIFLFGHNHTVESGKDRETNAEYSGEFFVPAGATMKVGADETNAMKIGYTYTTAGYLKQNTAATLLRIDGDTIRIDKFHKGTVADGFYDTTSRRSGAFADTFLTEGTHIIDRASGKLQNPMQVTVSVKKVKYSQLRKKAKKVSPIKVKYPQGAVTYTKESGSRNLTVNKSTGKVRVRKGTRKGTYKIVVNVTAAGNEMYKDASQTVTAKVRVK